MFRFKQFTIRQDQTAMKVCTDACVLGACADMGVDIHTPIRILDIGTGTGLLALMAAQRNSQAVVDAVEIDEAAFEQARQNIESSPFSDRVQVWLSRVQAWVPSPGIYHRILTNPPFYTNHLRSPDPAVNRALHTDDLPFTDLLEAVERLLRPDGQWWVLLPPYETTVLTNLVATKGLYPFRQLHLRHDNNKPVFRMVTGFAYAQQPLLTETLAIYEPGSNTYTPLFRALLRDFYLIF